MITGKYSALTARALVACLMVVFFSPAVQAEGGAQPAAARPCQPLDLRLYFATTRLNEGGPGKARYGGRRHLDLGSGSLDYGSACLARPPGLASPASGPAGAFKEGVRTNSRLWFKAPVVAIEKESAEQFFSRFRQWRGHALVYVHGYDISFDEALQDLALIADEFERRNKSKPLLPILFSWPSVGSSAEYSLDLTNLEWSQLYFRTFLSRLASEKNAAATLDVVGHSMGSRYLLSAFGSVPGATPPNSVRNLFLASADVDLQTAEQCKSVIEGAVSGLVYVLVSDRDGPLIASQLLNGQPRLGRPIDPPADRPSRRADLKELKTGAYWLNLIARTTDVVSKNGMNDPEAVRAWLNSNPGLAREFGAKSRLIDVTDVVSEDFGHGVAWPVIAALMSDPPSLSPLKAYTVYKRPDRLTLEQNGGKPTVLYSFLKVDTGGSTSPRRAGALP